MFCNAHVVVAGNLLQCRDRTLLMLTLVLRRHGNCRHGNSQDPGHPWQGQGQARPGGSYLTYEEWLWLNFQVEDDALVVF